MVRGFLGGGAIAAAVVLGGCECLTGFDAADGELAGGGETAEPEPHVKCLPGARRCALGDVESCDADGTWQQAEACPSGCLGGTCRARRLAAGHHHTCVLLDDGEAACFGRNDWLQTGSEGGKADCEYNDPPDPTAPPVECNDEPRIVPSVAGAIGIGSLGHHTCASDGSRVICWGSSSFGEIGNATSLHPGGSVPAKVDVSFVGDPVAELAIGGGKAQALRAEHSCLITRSGMVHCWGANCAGQLAQPAPAQSNGCPAAGLLCPEGAVDTNLPFATPVPLDFRAIQIAAGGAHTCTLDDAGSVRCWGLDNLGQVDSQIDFSRTCSGTPTLVEGLPPLTQLGLGGTTSCGVSEQGEVWCWGAAFNGVRGPNVIDPVQRVEGVTGARLVQVSHGTHACALLQNGDVWCWGSNQGGDAGVIDNIDEAPKEEKVSPEVLVPRRIDLPRAAVEIALGGNHGCVLLVDDGAGEELECWGESSMGQTGPDADEYPDLAHVVALP